MKRRETFIVGPQAPRSFPAAAPAPDVALCVGRASSYETAAPGTTRSWPSTITISPGRTSPSIAASVPSSNSTRTLRCSARRSAVTTYANCPSGPSFTAARGTTVASGRLSSPTATSTSSPGTSDASAFAKVARRDGGDEAPDIGARLDPGQVGLRQCERHFDRLDLRDRHERRRAVRRDEVAGLHEDG